MKRESSRIKIPKLEKALSIVIPTYNERDNIEPLVKAVHHVLDGYDYEIVFVDDNSKDGTIDVAKSLAASYPVRILVRTREKGLATAVIHGFKNAYGKVILVMDGDLQHPPEIIPALLKGIEHADIAVASRYVPGGGCQNWSLTRRIISKGAIILGHLLLPRTRAVKDFVSGFFMFRRSVIEGVTMNPTGYKILMELLYEGNYSKVVEVPFVFVTRSRGESKLKIKTQIDYLKHIYSLMRRKGELARFLKFCLVGASGFGVNEGLLWILRSFAGLPLPVASAIAIEASIISNFTLNDHFTFHDRRRSGIGSWFTRGGKFNVVSLVGAGINFGILLGLTHLWGEHYYLVANVIGVAVAMLFNFFANSLWTWKWQQQNSG